MYIYIYIYTCLLCVILVILRFRCQDFLRDLRGLTFRGYPSMLSSWVGPLHIGFSHWAKPPNPSRKGTNGVSTHGFTANCMFFDTDFLGTPGNLLLSSQKCQGVSFPSICQNSLLCSGPISVDLICPQPIHLWVLAEPLDSGTLPFLSLTLKSNAVRSSRRCVFSQPVVRSQTESGRVPRVSDDETKQ